MIGRINKTRKSFITAVGMSLVLLMASAFGILIDTKVGLITKPVAGTWADYAVKPAGSGVIHSDATMDVNDPYLIYTPQELAYFIKNSNSAGKHIKLMADIDLAGHEWEPITNSYPASIFIYGNNHVISNLIINQPNKDNIGFFGSAVSSLENKLYDTISMKDLTFANVDIIGKNNVGVVSGDVSTTSSKISNVQVTSGKIVGNNYVGGIIGGIGANAQILNCNNAADIFGKSMCVGGIAGESGGIIQNSFNYGDIWAESAMYVGGIAGYSYKNIENCYAECTIYGAGLVGGISGRTQMNITNSGFIGTIYCDTTPTESGAIASHRAFSNSPCEVKNCFAVATIHLPAESDLSGLHKFGLPSDINTYSTYCFTKVYIRENNSKKEYRKYKVHDNETEPFKDMVYHKNINGGYPFPKKLFAVGQFVESDTLAYLKEYGFFKHEMDIKYDGENYYMELGKYPQTYVGKTMNSTLTDWYNSTSNNEIRNYYNDNGTSSDTKVYSAYNYQGEEYVYVPKSIVATSTVFSDGSSAANGSGYWFKVEPIKWIFLNWEKFDSGDMEPVVIAEKALTANVTWNKNSSAGQTWAGTCHIREWLNGTFYNDTFSDVEKTNIKETTVLNNTVQEEAVDGRGESTTDRIYLASYSELTNCSLTNKLAKPTDYAIVNNCYMNNGNAAEYWTRSACSRGSEYIYIYSSYYEGLYYAVAQSSSIAVRPVFTLNI